MAVTVPLGPAVVNISGVRAGDRNLVQVTLTADGLPYDLTGLTLSAQARHKVTDETPAVTAEVEVTDEAGGIVVLAWPGDQVRDSLAGKASWQGVWDLQLADTVGGVRTVAAGSFTAVLDVTR